MITRQFPIRCFLALVAAVVGAQGANLGNVRVIDSTAPEFGLLFGRLAGPNLTPDVENLRSSSIILQNNDARDVVAYTLIWHTAKDSGGAGPSIRRTFSSLDTGGQGRYLIRAGAARLLTPDGGVLDERTPAPVLSSNRPAPPPRRIGQATFMLDAIVFDDGRLVGADSSNLLGRLRAMRNANADLAGEIQRAASLRADQQAYQRLSSLAAAQLKGRTGRQLRLVGGLTEDEYYQYYLQADAKRYLKVWNRDGSTGLYKAAAIAVQRPAINFHRQAN